MASNNMYTGCPVQHALQYIGGKWQIGILWHLRIKPLRFNAIRECLPGLTEKVLTENLKFFENTGIVEKEVFAAVPPRVEYRLTEDGRVLIPVIQKIIQWGYQHLQEEKVTAKTGVTPLPAIREMRKLR